MKIPCDILLKENILSYYLAGFILADGHINKNFTLIIELAKKDKTYLESIANLLNISKFHPNIKNNSIRITSISLSKNIIKKFAKKFDINHNKTLNAPTKIPSKFKYLVAMLVGLIDGDGYIAKKSGRKDSLCAIHCHKSWLDFYTKIYNIINIQHKISSPKIGTDGYLKWNLANKEILIYMKNFVIKHNLPVLSRKWSQINENYHTFRSNSKKRAKRIIKLLSEGYSAINIAKKIGCSREYIYIFKKRHNI